MPTPNDSSGVIDNTPTIDAGGKDKQSLSSNEASINAMLAQMAKLVEENARLKLEREQAEKEAAQQNERQVLLKVSDKKGVTFNAPGIRRFGMTYYLQEWETLFAHIDEIKAFVERNKREGKLSTLKQK